MSKTTQTDEYAGRLLMVSLFLPPFVQVWTIISACAYFVFRTVYIRRWPAATSYFWAVASGGLYLLYAAALPLTPVAYKHAAASLCERRLSLFVLPLIFSFIAPIYKKVIAGEVIYFVYACLITATLGNADYFYHYFFVKGGLHELSHVAYRQIFETFTGVHPTYMGIYLCFSVSILLLSAPAANKRTQLLRTALIYLLLAFLLSLLAKSPIIALVLIAAHYLYKRRGALKQFRSGFAGLAGLLVGMYALVPFFRQRMAELFGIGNAGVAGNITNNSVQVRKLIFNADASLLQHYWLTGAGPGRTLILLKMRYFFFSVANGYWVGYYDPHNEYFFEWISFGLTGIAVFIAILVLHFVRAIQARNDLYLYLLIIISTTFFTETLLSRQQGVLFYALFTSLMFFLPVKNKQHLS